MGALRAAAGSLVPEVIPTGAGSQVLELARPGSADYCVMFSCAPGREPGGSARGTGGSGSCMLTCGWRTCWSTGTDGYNATSCTLAEEYLSRFG
jgi:hypothetical protein